MNAQHAAEAIPRAPRRGSEILVLDDEPGQRSILSDLLRDEGYEPISCASASDALAQAARRVASAAIVDLRMPDMDGLEVLRRMSELHGSMRVILHTGYGSFSSAREAVNLGAYAFVEKLGDPHELLAHVRRAVETHHTQAAAQDEHGTLLSATEQAPDILLQIERDGTIAFASRCFAGRTVLDLVGRSVFDLVAPDYHAAVSAALGSSLDEECRSECDLAMDGTDGSRFWYECRLTSLTPRQGARRAVLVARNVTFARQSRDIEEVVRPLLRNALDAIVSGGSLVLAVEPVDLDADYVAGHKDARPGPHVRITVRDDGGGIPEETLDHIFDPFFSTKAENDHAGLGLTHVYSIVAKAGGHITVETAPGEGSTFRVYLPAANRRAPFPRAV